MERDEAERGLGEGATAARLFALLAGAGLVLGGVGGFLHEPSFGTGDGFKADDILGIFPTNGWDNLLNLLLGLGGLLLASRNARVYAFGLGVLFTVLALWGLAVTDHGSGTIGDLLPVGNADNLLHLAVGVAGLAAAFADGGARSLAERVLSRIDRAGGSARDGSRRARGTEPS